jgi:uncharacterized membrane protein
VTPLLAASPLTFEQPWLLLVALLAIPTAWMARAGAGGQSRAKLVGSVATRSLLLLLLAVALARPSIVDRGESVTLMVVADVSRSIPRELRQDGERFLARVEEAKRNEDDRIGVVTVAERSEIRQTPDVNARIVLDHAGDLAATDLSHAIETAISLLPTDTANRILLVSDGNETRSNVMEAIQLATANGIPIDVLPIEYEFDREIVFEGLRAPSRARIGQAVDLRAFIRSSEPTTGVLRLRRNDESIDLDPSAPGDGVRIRLEPGVNSIPIPVSMDFSGAHRFQVEFEPDDAESDMLGENNRYDAITFVSGEGRVLMVSETATEYEPTIRALRDGGLDVVVESPAMLGRGLPYLNGFDAVMLADVPRWGIDADADRALRAYVHDLGGGLVMMGGERSFGAGGWIDSEVASVLPVKLDPPQERQMTRGALALVMHSCEMPQGNHWGQVTAISAIEALSSQDHVGIITFDFGMGANQFNGCAWAFPMQPAGDKQGAIAAAKAMTVGDMPDFSASLNLARTGLNGVNAGQKHVIIISDGDPAPPSQQLLDGFVADGITITTVMVGGHGTVTDARNMQGVAEYTGGTYYNVVNPNQLPKIFIKEATLVSRSLVQEGDFPTVTLPAVDGPTRGVVRVPDVDGFVLTVAREGLAKTPLFVRTDEGDDPLLAFWNHGLGKSVAYTSDAGSRWAVGWTGWSGYQPFWEQIVRWSLRPATPSSLAIRSGLGDEGRAVVEVEALSDDGSFANLLAGEGVVIDPEGTTRRLPLQQIGPGRYRAEFHVDREGAYLVNAIFADPGGDASDAVSVQAAVSVPYRKEFATTRDNRTLLEMIADRTGGRVFDAKENLDVVDPFDRTGLEMPSSPTRIWDVVVVICAGLFLLDVAVRRLSFERERRAAAAANRPGSAVDAWRTARRRASRGNDEGVDGGEAIAGRKVELDGSAATDFSVSEATVDGSVSTTGRSRPVVRDDRAAQSTDADAGEDMTSRLLRAKRRAGTSGDDVSGGGSNG